MTIALGDVLTPGEDPRERLVEAGAQALANLLGPFDRNNVGVKLLAGTVINAIGTVDRAELQEKDEALRTASAAHAELSDEFSSVVERKNREIAEKDETIARLTDLLHTLEPNAE